VRRHITARILLSVLLLWQLGVGAFAHAYGMAPHDRQPPPTHESTMHESAMHESMGHQHCAEQADASSMKVMDMNGGIDKGVSTCKHSSRHSDCCQSLLCKCPCVQALALANSLPDVPAMVPDSLELYAVDAPLLYAGVSGLFRPPI
jgi:hypothetical protein